MKALKICTYMFLGVPIAMYYVRTLCDKYILSYDSFSWFLIGKFRHSVLICGVGVEWDSRNTAAYVHSIVIVFTPFYTTFLLKF